MSPGRQAVRQGASDLPKQICVTLCVVDIARRPWSLSIAATILLVAIHAQGLLVLRIREGLAFGMYRALSGCFMAALVMVNLLHPSAHDFTRFFVWNRQNFIATWSSVSQLLRTRFLLMVNGFKFNFDITRALYLDSLDIAVGTITAFRVHLSVKTKPPYCVLACEQHRMRLEFILQELEASPWWRLLSFRRWIDVEKIAFSVFF